jgi:hypothetical protein
MDRRASFSASVLATGILVGIACSSPAAAQTWASAPHVKEFLQSAGGEMRYIAAKVPNVPNEFVGALHIPGVQLLVVWAKYEQPTLLNDMLGKRNYQGVYADLNSASYTITASRLMFEDIREDGLDAYESAGKRVTFDGDWGKQKISEKDYKDALSQADQKYLQALTLLTAELKKGN